MNWNGLTIYSDDKNWPDTNIFLGQNIRVEKFNYTAIETLAPK